MALQHRTTFEENQDQIFNYFGLIAEEGDSGSDSENFDSDDFPLPATFIYLVTIANLSSTVRHGNTSSEIFVISLC